MPASHGGKVFGRCRQRGVALVLVLWILVLLTVTTGAFALMARMDQLEANQLLSGTQARLWAEAGINLAAVALRDTDDIERMVADGRSYEQVIDGVRIETSATDERGKLDVNAADEITLSTLFVNHGLDPEQAEQLAAAVMDWRDPDDAERVNGAEWESYEAAGLGVGPADRNFMMVDELLQVMGMPYELYRRLEPGITVFSGAAMPMIEFAPAEALLAIPDITPEEALEFVDQRHTQAPGDMMDLALPAGQTAMARGRGLTYSIRVRATMPNGVWDQVEATVRLGGAVGGEPFRVMRWKEGFRD